MMHHGVRYDASAHPAVVSENAQGSYEADFDTNEQSVTENEKRQNGRIMTIQMHMGRCR